MTTVAAARRWAAQRRSGLSMVTRDAITGYLFISPWLIGFIAFSLLPIIAVFALGVTDYDVLSAPKWAGLENYRTLLLKDRLVSKALVNTLYYVGIRVPIHIALAFLLALLLNARLPGISAFRSCIYLPSVVPIVGSAVVWVWILSPFGGVLNGLLAEVGIQGKNWLGSVNYSKPALIVISLYHVGTMMVIFLAGLQNIPSHLYEAARIDGAGSLQCFLNITIPMMTPTLFLNVVMDIINSFQVITYALLMTQGGPVNSTLFFVLYIYRAAFQTYKMGYASALAVVLFLIIVALTLPLFLSSEKWVQYEQI